MSEPIDRLLDQAEWTALDLSGARFTDEPDALYATHEATLEIGAANLRCYQLNDGQRVFDVEDVVAFLTPPPIPDEGAEESRRDR